MTGAEGGADSAADVAAAAARGSAAGAGLTGASVRSGEDVTGNVPSTSTATPPLSQARKL